MEDLKKLRDRIDWLDHQIASLLNERMRAVDQVGRVKRVNQQNVTDQSRENSVINNVEEVVQHPILKLSISNIYKEIMHESKVAQRFTRHLSQPFQRIGIIGLGLIGGSICKGIKMKDASIPIGTLIHETEDHTLALQEGWIDKEYASMEELIENSDLIILSTPLSTIVSIAEMIPKKQNKLVVMDVGSVKGEIVDHFEKLTCEQVEYVGTHPMSGKEKSSFANSQATLFVNRPWIVVPHKKNQANTIESIKELILYLGANPICLDPEIHDEQTALISHIPSILSKLYLDFVTSTDPQSLSVAGPGFESFTRIAHSSLEMRNEIVRSNEVMIKKHLNRFLQLLVEANR